MKLKNAVFIVLVLVFICVAVSESYVALNDTEEQVIERLFESNIFDDTKLYGVNGVGVGPVEKVLTVTLDSESKNNANYIKSYFETQLSKKGVTNYNVEVVLN